MSNYTYLIGLAASGLVMFTVGMIAATRERRARQKTSGAIQRGAPVPSTPH